MAMVVDIRTADDPRDIIHTAVHLLAEAKLVAFPTETVYAVTAQSLRGEAVERLRKMGSLTSQPPLPLVVKGAEEALDYLPKISRLGRKLMRRCWPGPVTLAFDTAPENGLLSTLPPETRTAAVSDCQVQLRVSAHGAVAEALRLLPAPLVALNETLADTPLLATAQDVENHFGDDVALIIDDGRCRYSEPSTVVRVDNEEWNLVQKGVVTETMLGRLASEVYLFVCTGNTCRSPMAEGLFRHHLADRLQCSEDELFDRGFVVASAGLAAGSGSPASSESVEVVGAQGIDLRSHESQPLTNHLLEQADHVFTMTRVHRDSILAAYPDIGDRVELLARDGSDISDPIGAGMDAYTHCKQEIERHIRSILDEIPIS